MDLTSFALGLGPEDNLGVHPIPEPTPVERIAVVGPNGESGTVPVSVFMRGMPPGWGPKPVSGDVPTIGPPTGNPQRVIDHDVSVGNPMDPGLKKAFVVPTTSENPAALNPEMFPPGNFDPRYETVWPEGIVDQPRENESWLRGPEGEPESMQPLRRLGELAVGGMVGAGVGAGARNFAQGKARRAAIRHLYEDTAPRWPSNSQIADKLSIGTAAKELKPGLGALAGASAGGEVGAAVGYPLAGSYIGGVLGARLGGVGSGHALTSPFRAVANSLSSPALWYQTPRLLPYMGGTAGAGATALAQEETKPPVDFNPHIAQILAKYYEENR